jgi:hypothetical protein
VILKCWESTARGNCWLPWDEHQPKDYTSNLTAFTSENYSGSAQTQVVTINRASNTAGFYIEFQSRLYGHRRDLCNVDAPGTAFNQLLVGTTRERSPDISLAIDNYPESDPSFHSFLSPIPAAVEAVPPNEREAQALGVKLWEEFWKPEEWIKPVRRGSGCAPPRPK